MPQATFTLQRLIDAGLPATSTDGNGANAATKFSRTLTPAEWQMYLFISNPTAVRQLAAKLNAGKVSELKGGVSISQARTWLTRKVHGSDTEASLIASVDAATTVADLKTIIKKIITASYERTETDKIILALLLSIADEIMPDR